MKYYKINIDKLVNYQFADILPMLYFSCTNRVFNGKGAQPLEKILKLSDAFKVPTVKNPILSKSENLSGYSLLIYKIQTYTKQGMSRDEAIELSIKECIQKGR